MLFQRGNAPARDGLQPVDATTEISWRSLAAHLADPGNIAPPAIENVTRYELGTLDGVRLTFSDADCIGDERILYRSEEHTSELQSLMRISYAVFCLTKKKHK